VLFHQTPPEFLFNVVNAVLGLLSQLRSLFADETKRVKDLVNTLEEEIVLFHPLGLALFGSDVFWV